MRFKVPQNIDMQDRILGPLTMVQFVYAVVGFGLCYSIYMSLPSPFSFVLIGPIALLVFCLDFVKMNERPFQDFLLAAIEFIFSPKRLIWQQSHGSNFEIEVYSPTTPTKKFEAKGLSASQINAMAQSVDRENNQLIKK